jgi:hypothetical protein
MLATSPGHDDSVVRFAFLHVPQPALSDPELAKGERMGVLCGEWVSSAPICVNLRQDISLANDIQTDPLGSSPCLRASVVKISLICADLRFFVLPYLNVILKGVSEPAQSKLIHSAFLRVSVPPW